MISMFCHLKLTFQKFMISIPLLYYVFRSINKRIFFFIDIYHDFQCRQFFFSFFIIVVVFWYPSWTFHSCHLHKTLFFNFLNKMLTIFISVFLCIKSFCYDNCAYKFKKENNKFKWNSNRKIFFCLIKKTKNNQ